MSAMIMYLFYIDISCDAWYHESQSSGGEIELLHHRRSHRAAEKKDRRHLAERIYESKSNPHAVGVRVVCLFQRCDELFHG